MTVTSLGRLESVNPREIWESEPRDFTPWLALEENLALLGDTIGLELESQGTEQSVGPFRADIVCRDTVTGSLVLVENQLGFTDHTHLGQILTYAAGLNAVTVVWIARKFTEEHRAALDWLNDITSDQINFFGLEIEVYQIGNSAKAPKFNVVSKPNNWIKLVVAARNTGSGTLTKTQVWQMEYWTQCMDYVSEHSRIIKPRKPPPQHWTDFAIGHSDFALEAYVHEKKHYVGISLVMTGENAKANFQLLARERMAINGEFGAELDWDEMPAKKSSAVSLYLHNTEPVNRSDWPRQHKWILDKLETFHRVFAPRLKTLRFYSENQ